MSLIIKCGGECCSVDGYPPVAAWAFTVRQDHRVIHRRSGTMDTRAGISSAAEPATAAVREALNWLQDRPCGGDRVILRFNHVLSTHELERDQLLQAAHDAGWSVELEPVSPEWVSEAIALARIAITDRNLSRWIGSRPRVRAARKGRSTIAKRVREPARERETGLPTMIICDGGCKPEPGSGALAAYGFLVWTAGRTSYRESGVVCRGRAANSQVAELGAVVAALRWLTHVPKAPGSKVEIRSDCSWVVLALTGRDGAGPVPGTILLLQTAARFLSRLRRSGCQVRLVQVPRRLVADADAMCRAVYKSQAAIPVEQQRKPLKEFLCKARPGCSQP